MNEQVKSPEKSLSYIAWSVKEIAQSLKEISKMMGEYMQNKPKNEDGLENVFKGHKQEEIPF